MIREDHIVIPSKNTELLVKIIKEYFNDDTSGHKEVQLAIYTHRREDKSLVIFNSKIDNQHFVFFHGYLTTEDEFWKEGYCGWFHISDKISPNVPKKQFGGSMSNDGFSRNVMLGLEMTGDYVVGYTADNYRVQFNYNGSYEMTPAKGYQISTESLEHYEYSEELKFEAKAAKEFNKEGEISQTGCLMWGIRFFLYPFSLFLIWFSFDTILPNGNYWLGALALAFGVFYILIDILALRESRLKKKNK